MTTLSAAKPCLYTAAGLVRHMARHPALRRLYALAWSALVTVILLQSSSQPVVGPAAPPGPPPLERELYLTAGHILGFSVLTALWWWALSAGDTPHRRAALMAAAASVFVGIATELAQTLVPDRSASAFDLGVNVVVTLCTAALLGRLRRKPAQLRIE